MNHAASPWTVRLFVLLLLLLAFLNIGGKSFWATHAESRRAEVARTMVESGDYLIPAVNGKPILTKPPLFFWSMAAIFALTGDATEGRARLVSALAGLATLWLTFIIGARLYNTATSLWATAVLATNYQFVFFMRFAELDMLFTLFITLSFYCLLRLWQENQRKWAILFWVAAAAAFMVKGPFALIFPLVAFIPLVFITAQKEKLSLSLLFPWQGILLFLLLVAPWFIHVFLYSDAGAVFLEEVAARVIDRRGQNRGIFYYVASLGNFAPWVFLLPFALWWSVRHEREKNMFALLWFGGGMVVASLISAKNHHYILPLYPAMALITGRYLATHLPGVRGGAKKVIEGFTLFVTALLALLLCALPFAPAYSDEIPTLDSRASGAMALASLLLLGYVATTLRHNLSNGVISLVAGLLITFTYAHSVITPALGSRNSHKNFLMAAQSLIPLDAPLRMYHIENFQVPFYLRRNAPVVENEDRLAQFNEKNAQRYFIITEVQFREEALRITGGAILLRDDHFTPPRPSAEGERFILIYAHGKEK